MTRPGSSPRSRSPRISRTPSASPLGVAGSRSCRLPRSPAQSFETDALDPVAEAFARRAVRTEVDEHRAEQGWNRADGHVGRVQAVETPAVEVARQHDVVLSQRGADQTHVPPVRPLASAGAPAHTEADTLR